MLFGQDCDFTTKLHDNVRSMLKKIYIYDPIIGNDIFKVVPETKNSNEEYWKGLVNYNYFILSGDEVMFRAKEFAEVAKYLLSISGKTKNHPPNTMIVKKGSPYPPSLNFFVDYVSSINLDKDSGTTYVRKLRNRSGPIGITTDEPHSIIGVRVGILTESDWIKDRVIANLTPTGLRLHISISDFNNAYNVQSMEEYIYLPYSSKDVMIKLIHPTPDPMTPVLPFTGIGVYHLSNGCETLIHKLDFKDYAKE